MQPFPPPPRQQQADAGPIVRPLLSTRSAVYQHLLILSPPQCPLFILLSLLFFFLLRPHLFLKTSFTSFPFFHLKIKSNFLAPAPPVNLHCPVQELPALVSACKISERCCCNKLLNNVSAGWWWWQRQGGEAIG